MNVLVIGGCNIDIIGKSKNPLIHHESNVGDVNLAVGGVAKNVANNLLNLGADVSFLTLIGNDFLAKMQVAEFNEVGLNFEQSFRKEKASSIYLATHDSNGDMTLAINDMKSIEALTKEDFQSLDPYIKKFQALVFDTNLSEETLTYLIETYQDKRIFVDGVSQTKVKRIAKVIQYIDLLKINHYELNSLLNQEDCDIILGVKQIVSKGLKTLIVSDGDEPITYNVNEHIYRSETQKIKKIKSTMGAGDALFSGIIYYLMNGKDIHEAVKFGQIVALETLKVTEACNKDIKKLSTI